MQELIIDGCKCTCDTASFVQKVSLPSGPIKMWEIAAVVLVVLLVILGLIVGYKKHTTEW